MTIPSWCRCPADLIGREHVLDQARAVVEQGPLSLVGPAGVGTTVLGGALMQRLLDDGAVQRVVAVPLDSCTEACDLVLALGMGVGAQMRGDETSVLDALSHGPATAVLLDDADLAPEATQHVLQLAPTVWWILTGRSALTDHAVQVPPLQDDEMRRLLPADMDPGPYEGLPLRTLIPLHLAPDTSFDDVLKAWPAMRKLARVPMGTGTYKGVADPLLAREVAGRTISRRTVREALHAAAGGDPEVYGETLRERAVELHQIACDMLIDIDPMDLRMLRTAARSVVDPKLSVMAAAAAARIHLRVYQASDALNLVRDHLTRGTLTRASRGLLRWIEGDALLSQGTYDLAHEAHLAAASDLRNAPGATRATILLARKCADAWTARDDALRARRWLAIARNELARSPDARALADTLRIAGNLAAQAGEHVGAEALYDEALATLSPVPDARADRAYVRLGQVAVAMSRNQFAEAEALLHLAKEAAVGEPIAEAAVAWREAELDLRRGRRDEAKIALDKALDGFAGAGTLLGLRLCTRMEGDLAAVRGDRLDAVRAWQHSMSLCVRTRNLAGLRRLLRRRLVVEREGLPGPHLDELEQHLDLVEVLLQSNRAAAD